MTALYDVNVERNVLGAILCYGDALDRVRDLLCRDSFSTTVHKDIYTASLTLSSKGDEINVISVTDELKRMGAFGDITPFNVVDICGCATPYYYRSALILFEFFSRHKVWEIGQKLVTKALDLTFDLSVLMEEADQALTDVFSTPASGIATIGEAADELYQNYIRKNLSGEAELTGAPTGIGHLDAKSGGLHSGDLIVVAAETSQGKTSFALSVALSAARQAFGVAIYSMEMGKAELFARLSAAESGLPVSKLLYSKLSDDELSMFDQSKGALVPLPVYFDDKSTSNIDVIVSSIRTMVAKHKISGVVIDYLQILNVNMDGSNKEQQMAEVARRLKNLAKDLDIWVIALSQLRRDPSNHIPTLNRLRDSGQIAEAADIVILLYRPEVYNLSYPDPFRNASTRGTAMVDIAKGRNIGLDKFLVGFNPVTTRFLNLEQLPQDYGLLPVRDEQPF